MSSMTSNKEMSTKSEVVNSYGATLLFLCKITCILLIFKYITVSLDTPWNHGEMVEIMSIIHKYVLLVEYTTQQYVESIGQTVERENMQATARKICLIFI